MVGSKHQFLNESVVKQFSRSTLLPRQFHFLQQHFLELGLLLSFAPFRSCAVCPGDLGTVVSIATEAGAADGAGIIVERTISSWAFCVASGSFSKL